MLVFKFEDPIMILDKRLKLIKKFDLDFYFVCYL